MNKTSQEMLISKIKKALINNKSPISNENIIVACCTTIIEMNNRNRYDFDELLSIILNYIQENVPISINSKIFLKTISIGINNHYKLAYSILKTIFKMYLSVIDNNNFTEAMDLLEILIKNIHNIGISNLIVKYYNMDLYFNKLTFEQKKTLLTNSIELLDQKINYIEFLKNTQTSNNNNLVLKYLEYKNANQSDLTNEDLCELIELIFPDSDDNLRIILEILSFNKKNFLKNKHKKEKIVSIFSSKFIDLIRHEVIEVTHDECQLTDLWSLLSDFVLPYFINLISEMNNIFIEKGSYSNILRNIISYIEFEEFVDIIQLIDIKKHFQIFKGISNVDLNVVVSLYKKYINTPLDYSKTEEFQCICEEDSFDYFMTCLPSFCFYCTDNYDNIDNLLKNFYNHIFTHNTVICSALEKLIVSHQSNLKDNLILKHPIDKEVSKLILIKIRNSDLFQLILKGFITNKNADYNFLLQLLIELHRFDFFENIISVILSGEPAVFKLQYNSCILSEHINLYDGLRLLPFFIKDRILDYDIISRIVELSSSKEPDIQKKAYNLLYFIYKNRRTSICICELLYSSMEQSVNSSSERNRIMLQYTILQHGCENCKIDKSLDIKSKFLTELLKNFRIGNSKCKKYIKECILEIFEDQYFREFLLNHINKNNADYVILNGCVDCMVFLMEHMNHEYFKSTSNDIQLKFQEDAFRALLSIGTYSCEVIKPMLKLFSSALAFKNFNCFIPDIFEVVDSYILQYSKKYNFELKNFCILCEKYNLGLTKTMKTLLKFKNKSGKPKEFSVLKKVDFNEML